MTFIPFPLDKGNTRELALPEGHCEGQVGRTQASEFCLCDLRHCEGTEAEVFIQLVRHLTDPSPAVTVNREQCCDALISKMPEKFGAVMCFMVPCELFQHVSSMGVGHWLYHTA